MQQNYPTIILRHRKENLKKCSLRGLELRDDFHFYTYPKDPSPDLSNYFLLTLDAPLLSKKDQNLGLFLVDGTWKYSEIMIRQIEKPPIYRSLPLHFRTAYPRRQEDCKDPTIGLASVEALYIAYSILGWNLEGLLDHYHWRSSFLQKNIFV